MKLHECCSRLVPRRYMSGGNSTWTGQPSVFILHFFAIRNNLIMYATSNTILSPPSSNNNNFSGGDEANTDYIDRNQNNSRQERAPSQLFTSDDLLIDDTLPILERVVKYSTAQMALQRSVHVRMLGETANIAGSEASIERLVPLLTKLSVDAEAVIRRDLAFQLYDIAEACCVVKRSKDVKISKINGEINNIDETTDNGSNIEETEIYVKGYQCVLHDILPVIASLLADTESMEVRSAASEALVSVASLLELDDLASHILTIVIQLAGNDTVEELRITGAELLNMLSPILCKEEVCGQFITPTVQNLAEDGAFRVRMAVARHITNIFRTSSTADITEKLLPAFFNLTEDEIWGVRKACAESLWQIAQVLPEELRISQNSIGKRKPTLTKVYRRFVTSDPSKWVRNTAFQYLGQFLTVMGGGCEGMKVEYENGTMTSIEFNTKEIVIVNGKTKVQQNGKNKSSKSPTNSQKIKSNDSASSNNNDNNNNNNNRQDEKNNDIVHTNTTNNNNFEVGNNNLNVKNETIIKSLSPLSHVRNRSNKKNANIVDENLLSVYQSMAYPDSSDRMSPPLERMLPTLANFRKNDNRKLDFGNNRRDSSGNSVGNGINSDGNDLYNRQRSSSMDFEGSTNTSDPYPDPDDLAMFCAYSLPGVAYVLGPDKWEKSLRHVFLTLVENPQARVRRTLAYSLHRLAQILGPVKSEKELLNAFDTLLHDIDEVRVGVVENLATFLQALDNPCRESFLVVMSEILEGVGRRNWRFRLLLANQLGTFGTLFSPPATVSVIQSLTFKMLNDPVANVRRAGALCVGTIANRLDGEFDWRDTFIERLVNELGKAASYHLRLLFVEVCIILKREMIKTDVFETLCRETLMNIKDDPVSNVRETYERATRNGLL
jgi:serine/threonine-protein phosphatase 4 regulatory subunit 1